MAKINTAFIKKNILPNGGKGWKRESSRKFDYNNETVFEHYDGKAFHFDGKLNWRKYHNEEEYEDIYVIHNADEVLYSGPNCYLPMSCFDFSFETSDLFSLWAFYKPEYEDIAHASDDLRCESISNLIHIFQENGVAIGNAMENCWELYIDEDKHFKWDDGPKAANDFLKGIVESCGGNWRGMQDDCGDIQQLPDEWDADELERLKEDQAGVDIEAWLPGGQWSPENRNNEMEKLNQQMVQYVKKFN